MRQRSITTTPDSTRWAVLRGTLSGVAVVACACSGAVGHPGERSRLPAPTPGTLPVPGADAKAPPAGDAALSERHVWTTLTEQDTCEEFPVSEAPPYSQFETRSECEAWVGQRVCRPGFSCFDGCNTVSCDLTGMHLRMTLVDCRLLMPETIEFQVASLIPKGSPPPKLAAIQAALAQALEAPSRKVIVIGHAGHAEGKTSEARERLALGRAEVVRRLLVDAGMPGERLIARSASAAGSPPVPLPAQRSVVSFEFDPDRPTRADADPEAQRTRRWCD